MICDADCLIANSEAKWLGSIHDSRVFWASTIDQKLSPGRPDKYDFLSTSDIIGSIFVPAQIWSKRMSRRICNFVQCKRLFSLPAPSRYFHELGCAELGGAVQQGVGW